MTRQTGPPPGPVADLWTQAAAELEAAHADVQPTQMFGSTGLKADGKTFAMIVKDRLVVKLPRDRVQDLVDSGAGQRFDPGHGRQMKQWISVAPADLSTCRALVTEAHAFVTSIPPVTPGGRRKPLGAPGLQAPLRGSKAEGLAYGSARGCPPASRT